MRRLGWGCVFVAAALFIAAVVFGQINCPIPHCNGPDLDAWMPAFLLTPLGFPALVLTIFFVARKIWPNSRLLSVAPKYLILTFIGLAILLPFLLGYINGRTRISPPVQVHQ
ncbi:MAG: hypothetical protein WAN03_11450 [Candidatus Sulfotelmatobacter sp.]